jgi:hypothetical protein
VKAAGKLSNRLAGNFGLYRKEGNGRVGLSYHWLTMGQNGKTDSHRTTQQTNSQQEQEFRMAQKKGGFAGLGNRHGKHERVLGREPTCKEQRLQKEYLCTLFGDMIFSPFSMQYIN